MTSKKYTISLDGLPGHENVIFKLICSVSERTKNREVAYSLAAVGQKSDISIKDISNKTASADAENIDVWIADKKDDADNTIARPLIATRVLSILDNLVAANANNKAEADSNTSVEPAEVAQSRTAPEAAAPAQFDISEEEASELAIVHDEILENPANAETSAVDVNKVDLTLLQKDKPGTESNSDVPRVLVVDDSQSVRKQLELELELFDVSVDFAEDGNTAFNLLKDNHYDLALLDVVLPDKDGFLICKHIKSTSKDTIAIMLTGKATQADKIKGSLAGCNDYLIKPVGRNTFQNAVKHYIPLKNISTAIEA